MLSLFKFVLVLGSRGTVALPTAKGGTDTFVFCFVCWTRLRGLAVGSLFDLLFARGDICSWLSIGVSSVLRKKLYEELLTS